MHIKTSFLFGIFVTLITTTTAEAEPCTAWATAATIYHYEFIEGDFVSNDMLTGLLVGTSSLQSQSNPSDPCDPITLVGPRLTLTADYPIVDMWHDAEYLIPGTTYQWAYPDISLPSEGYHVDATFDPAVISVTYVPGFLLSRSVSPNELSSPGGTQTLTIEITPLESFVGPAPLSQIDFDFGWVSRHGLDGYLIRSPTMISYTSNAPEHSCSVQTNFGYCSIGGLVVGTTYTVEVTYTVEIDNGVTAIETAPGVIGRARFNTDWSSHYGNTATLESEGATWQWETENEVQWFGHEGELIKSVALSGYEIPYQCPNSDNDHDGVPDMTDNCTLVANHSQRDTDGDGFGNFCDPDFDNNGLINFADLAYMKSVFFSADPDADLDGSGLVNFTDLAIVKSMFFGPPGPGDPPFNTAYDFQSIDPLGNGLGWGLGVDDNGNVTGSIDIGGDYIGFILAVDSGIFTYIPELGVLFDLNNAGRGSGSVYDEVGVENCFIRETDGSLTSFSPPSQTSGGYANCEGRGINSQGIVSGFEYGEAGFIAFSYDSENDVFEEFLSTAPGEQTIVGQVNDQGQLVGSVFYGTTDQACPGSPVGYYSFRRDADGSVKFFTIEGNLTTRARGIADNGQVTGFFTDETGWQRSYVAVVSGGPGFEDIQLPDYKLLDATDCIADPGPVPYPAEAGQEWIIDADSFGTAIRGDGAVVGVCDGYYVLVDTNNGNEIDWVYLGSSGFIATPIE